LGSRLASLSVGLTAKDATDAKLEGKLKIVYDSLDAVPEADFMEVNKKA